ncbi:MAG TPA: hypothetical protein VMU81_12340 [Acetobacteraceae bacterium]|nr:hypothetical protein [Acetobacteraceae bacterium]
MPADLPGKPLRQRHELSAVITTYTWQPGVGADWATPADWNSTSYQDANTAAAVISVAGIGDIVTIAGGETAIVSSITNGNLYIDDSLTSAPTLDTPLTYSGTLAGLDLDDSLVLYGISADVATAANGTTLAVLSNGVTVDTLAPSANYTGASFIAATVGPSAAITDTGGALPREDMAFTISVDNSWSPHRKLDEPQ